ncbi:MAG TPA: hypothetical protein VGX91_07350 [Candidatus Cybelea sp.]|jgi:hypothetical protein|nr:hypothetical protein [Candidatus Cybelea sp.]
MARKLTAPLVLAVVAWCALASASRAQSLERLTVESFALSTDAARPQVDAPFHLIVSLRVREQVSEVDNLDLPMLAQLELLGDERSIVSDSRGTQYRETITVVAHAPGAIAIAPATLQAIDARDGKAKEWYTNDLRLVAVNSPANVMRAGEHAAVWALEIAVAVVAGGAVVALIVLAVVLASRRRPVAVAVPVAAPEPPPLQRTHRQDVEDARAVLGAERTRATAIAVRAAIWRSIGASEGATLGDVLARPGCNVSPLRETLVALERSAFTYDEDLTAAIDDAVSALQRYSESLT